jgi:hypothetical protein
MPVIPAPRRLRQEDLKFKAILNYKVPPPLPPPNKTDTNPYGRNNVGKKKPRMFQLLFKQGENVCMYNPKKYEDNYDNFSILSHP